MSDHDVKAIFKQASQEQTSTEVDDIILAQAKAALSEKQTIRILRRGWKPVLATAASVTIVASLAFQLVPLHEQQWTGESEPAAVEKLEETMSIQAEQPATLAAEESAEKSLIALDAQTVQDAEPGSSSRTMSPSRTNSTAADLAHFSADQARLKRAEEVKKRRLNEQQRLMELQQSPKQQLSDEQIIEVLTQIQQLMAEGNTERAELIWLKLQSQVAQIPESETVSLMWKKVANSFE